MLIKMHRFAIFSLIFSAIFVFATFVKAEDTKIIYPAGKSVIFVSKIIVIGKTGDNRNLSLHVENSSGKKKYKLSPADGYFNHEVRLSRGKNRLSLKTGTGASDAIEIFLAVKSLAPPYPDDMLPYYLHSENNLTGECELCHPGDNKNKLTYKSAAQKLTCITSSCHPNFDKGKFLHGPFQDGSCIECHNPHGSKNKNFLKYFKSDLCFTCHTDAKRMMEEATSVHYPVSKGECTACHDPHKSNLEYHLKRETMVDLCAGCHGRITTSHKVMHEPVESGDCNVCHLPHVSENKALLSEKGSALCFNCHEVRKEEFQSKYVHEPVSKNCTSCHDPHGSASKNHLRSRRDEIGNYISAELIDKDLCLGCHRKLDPEVVEQIEGTVQHDPVVTGKCTVCHTPHSTNYSKQLKEPAYVLCFSCHKKMEKLITGSKYRHGPVHTNGCVECHLPHGAGNKNLLRAKFSEKYADKFDIDNFALCFICHSPEVVLERETEMTDFRNGRESLHYVHVNRKKKGRNCKTCHAIHAADQEKHIRKKIPFKKKFTISLAYTKTDTGGGCIVGCHKPRKYDRVTPVIN